MSLLHTYWGMPANIDMPCTELESPVKEAPLVWDQLCRNLFLIGLSLRMPSFPLSQDESQGSISQVSQMSVAITLGNCERQCLR